MPESEPYYLARSIPLANGKINPESFRASNRMGTGTRVFWLCAAFFPLTDICCVILWASFFKALIFLSLKKISKVVKTVSGLLRKWLMTTLLKCATCFFHVFAKLFRSVFRIRKTFRCVVGEKGFSIVMFLIHSTCCHCM